MGGGGKGTKQVSYQFFTAFISLLNNMELVKRIFTSAAKGQVNTELTKGSLVRMCACVCACMCVCVHVCVHVLLVAEWFTLDITSF